MSFIKQILLHIKMVYCDDTINRFSSLKRNFGMGFAVKCVLFKYIAILSNYKINWYQKHIYSFCESFFKEISKKYINCSNNLSNKVKKICVWVMWWQGLDFAPEIVKTCVASQKKFLKDNKFEYHIITKKNYKNYIKFSDSITEKVKNGQITLTHFSDILRMELLKKYGGLWIDATIYMTGEFKDDFYSFPIYTNKKFTYPEYMRKIVSKGRWTGYFLKGEKNNPLFCFMCDAFQAYWEKYDCLIDYYLIDYTIAAAYNMIPCVHMNIDAVPENNQQIFELSKIINKPYSHKLFEQICKNTVIHKLSYKIPYIELTPDKQDTTWMYIKQKM